MTCPDCNHEAQIKEMDSSYLNDSGQTQRMYIIYCTKCNKYTVVKELEASNASLGRDKNLDSLVCNRHRSTRRLKRR